MPLSIVFIGHGAISTVGDTSRAMAGGSDAIWLRAQLQYDLWNAEQKSKAKVKPTIRHAGIRFGREKYGH